MKPLLDLGPRECRWPVETHGKDHLFCGGPVEPGCAYCSGHKRLAYKPGSALNRLGEGVLDRMADSYAGSRHRSGSRGTQVGEVQVRDVVADIKNRTADRSGAINRNVAPDEAALARRLKAQDRSTTRKRHALVGAAR